MTGVKAETEEILRCRLSSNEQVLEWRLLQLDVEDAYNLGRYEEAILLGWGALETVCRTEAPRLARAAGVSAVELQQRITGDTSSKPPFSLEEVAERASITSLLRVCCELAKTGYDPGSLTQSARNARRLRNVITHRGIRLSPSQALRALDAINFVLNTLQLPTSRSPESFDYQSWTEHFGKASIDFPKLLNSNEGRIVVYRPERESLSDPLAYWFQLERVDNRFVVRIPEEIDEEVAAVLVVVMNDSFRYGAGQFPHLRIDASMQLIHGLLDEVARTTTEAVHWAHAAIIRAQEGLSVQIACDYAVDSICKGFTRLNHTLDSSDARFIPLCTRIASYLVHASPSAFQRFRQKWQNRMLRSQTRLSKSKIS